MPNYTQALSSDIQNLFPARSDFWLRQAKLVVQNKYGEIIQYDSKDFQIDFNIIKGTVGNKTTPNESSISIYGIKKDARNRLYEEGSRTVLLYAGYRDPVLLFSGDVSEVINEKQGDEIITSIYADDGGEIYTQSDINKSYPAGVTLDTMINDLTKSMNAQGYNVQDIPSVTYNSGKTISGASRDELQKLCNSYGLNWSIQNGVIQIHKSSGYNGTSVCLLNKESGLIGSPARVKKNKKTSNQSSGQVNDTPSSSDSGLENTENDVKVVSLLQPTLIPGSVVKIESIILSGYFKIKNITHTGSASVNGESQNFYSEMTVNEIK